MTLNEFVAWCRETALSAPVVRLSALSGPAGHLPQRERQVLRVIATVFLAPPLGELSAQPTERAERRRAV